MLKRFLAAAATAVAGLAFCVVAPQSAQAAATDVYSTPGDHLVNGRYWHTECEKYSTTVVRCTTEIWGDKVVRSGGSYVTSKGWVFNNLTYLPSTRSQWKSNPLGVTTKSWTASDGRQWRTECDTALTGKNGCRSFAKSTVVSRVNGRYVSETKWQFNNIVRFSTSRIPAVTKVPAAAPPLASVPSESSSAATQSCKASYYWDPQKTANGETFNPNALTTAHKSLPFNTRVKVTNPNNGKSVVVRVNDRGPYISGRCLDLSRAAMETIGDTSAGVLTVNYQVLD
ncbi:rare lipoprotein A [Tessaracoccus bendigoensis DSM 12906]|uniref:Probable endolytic peptidoglycan transglycosylase RlpA n=1 Tax=Tessaracoccus bendigoensis DSM 12906 TaxID=1123357 RepID=A0A1M6N5N8_9ACTN|nr:rare lipoprotein A [Tessaracoccus bendigoensis DSM 12906]